MIFRQGLFLLGGNLATSVTLFIRNLVVARLIPIEDYGIAATFAMTMAVVEMASTLGLQQQIVQARDGDDPRFQKALQGFQVLRGLASSLALLLLAEPIARFLSTGEAVWAYRVLAVIPLLNAFQHFDVHRLNRTSRFGPLILTGAVPAIVSLLAVWPLVDWFGDWRVVLFAILIQAAVGLAVSHWLAERPYGLVFDAAIIRRSLRFGWPLLVNGVVMYLVLQGDRLIVARLFGIEALAIFSMGVTLAMTPALILSKTTQSLFLPLLSRADRSDPAGRKDFDRIVMQMFAVYFAFAALFPAGVLVVGGPFIDLVLGDKFAALAPILTSMAVAQGVFVLKGAPATVALALGRTVIPLWANLVRVVFLPVAAGLGFYSGEILAVILVAIMAELLGFIVAVVVLQRHSGMRVRPILAPATVSLGIMGAVLAVALATQA